MAGSGFGAESPASEPGFLGRDRLPETLSFLRDDVEADLDTEEPTSSVFCWRACSSAMVRSMAPFILCNWKTKTVSYRDALSVKERARASKETDLEHGFDEGPPWADVDTMQKLKDVDHKRPCITGRQKRAREKETRKSQEATKGGETGSYQGLM